MAEDKLKHAYERNGIVYVTGTIEGIRYRKSTGKKATLANLRWVNENWQEVIQGVLLDNQRLREIVQENLRREKSEITFEAYAENMLQMWEQTLKFSTLSMRGRLLKLYVFPYFKTVRLIDCDYAFLRDWFFGLKLKNGERLNNNSKNLILSIVSQIFSEAEKEGIIEKNPAKQLGKLKSEKTDRKPFTEEEIQKIINAEHPLRDFAVIALFTGMRTGELLALQWENVDFENKQIHINKNRVLGRITTPKTGVRTIDMLPIVENALRSIQLSQQSKSLSFVFSGPRKHCVKGNNALRFLWVNFLNELSIKYKSVYHTRHTFASLMISR